jgi:hypothetical protein
MTLRIVGAGLGRTGTMSLKLALEKLLGAPCYHMQGVFQRPDHVAAWTAAARGDRVDWQELMRGYSAAVDWPACAFWRELSAENPDAWILLSTRDAERWWESASATIFPASRSVPRGDPWRDMVDALFESRFTTQLRDRDACLAAFERHYASVRAEAPRERLLEWSPSDGWEPLCQALGVSVPDEPFPHANTRDDFLARRL